LSWPSEASSHTPWLRLDALPNSRWQLHARVRSAHPLDAVRFGRFLVLLLLCACTASVGGGGTATPRPDHRTCSFFAVAYAWIDTNRDGSPGPDELPLRRVHIHLDQLDRGGPHLSGPASMGATDRGGYTFFRVFLAGCPPTRFEFRPSTPGGFVPTTPVHVPVMTGDTVRFGFVRRGA
jgi:hypothetical protein